MINAMYMYYVVVKPHHKKDIFVITPARLRYKYQRCGVYVTGFYPSMIFIPLVYIPCSAKISDFLANKNFLRKIL